MDNKQRKFRYSIEYIIYTPGNGRKAQDILIAEETPWCRVNEDFVGIVDNYYMVNCLRHSPYKFYDTLVKEIDETKEPEWKHYKVLRALDECEIDTVNHAIKLYNPVVDGKPVNDVIEDALRTLMDHDINIGEHGWYKIRLPA